MLEYKIRIKKTVIWGAATAALIYIFYFLIPIDSYQSATTFLAIIGSISITITFCIFFFGFTSLFDVYNEDGKVKDRPLLGYIFVAIFFISLFGNGVLIIWNEVQEEQKELTKNGVIVMAKIVNGSSFTSRRIDLSDISVEFTESSGINHRLKVEISKYEFDRFYLNQEIPILYSTKYMSINRVIYKEEDFLKYPHQ